mgnify:CR=1 FL=1
MSTVLQPAEPLASSRPRQPWGPGLLRRLSLFSLIALLCFLTLFPTLMLFYGSVHSAPPGSVGEFNLDGYRQMLTGPTFTVLLNSVGLSLAKTIPSIVLAVLLAWIVARTDTPFAKTLEVLITLPFFIPPILTALAWSMLGNKQVGLINQAWRWLTGGPDALVNVYSYGGVVWHMMQYATVFLFLFIVDAFRGMDPSLEEAARMSGASRWRTLRQITLVLMTPVLIASFMLSLIRGIESFESPLFFGTPAGITVITTEIYNAINHRAVPDYQYATALSIGIVAFMFLLVVLQWRILAGRSFATVTGKGYRPSVTKLGRWRWVTFAVCVLFFIITVVLPVSQLLLSSFFKFFGFYTLDTLTLDNYRALWENDEFWRALRNTLLLGLAGASLTMGLGSVVAYVGVRTRLRSRLVVDALAWLPWMMPGMVLGVGFLWAFAVLPASVPIYGTLWALLIAYIALGTPLATRVMSASYAQLSFDLEECSRVHGASWWQTLWRILIALSWPSFMVGWILTFFSIMRELSASILLYSVGTETLSVIVLKLWSAGKAEEVSVIGLFMIALVILFRLVHLRLVKRRVGAL